MHRDTAIKILESQLRWLKETDQSELDLSELQSLWYPGPHVQRQLSRIQAQLSHILERDRCRCAMQSDEGQAVLQLMTSLGPAERDKGVNHIRQGLSGAHRLVICDPYLLKGARDLSPKELVAKFSESIPMSVKRLELFVRPRARDPSVAREVNKLCEEREIRLVSRKTSEFHDRVWIGDDEVAYSVGASFNGLGNKPAFILRLPPEDTRAFVVAIRDARDTLPRSKSA